MQIANLTANFNVGKCISTVKFQRDENAELGFSLLEHTNIDCIPNIYIEMINHVIEFIFTSPLVETACNDLNLAHVDYNNNPIQWKLYAMKDIMKVTNLTMALDFDMGTIDLEFDAKKDILYQLILIQIILVKLIKKMLNIYPILYLKLYPKKHFGASFILYVILKFVPMSFSYLFFLQSYQ